MFFNFVFQKTSQMNEQKKDQLWLVFLLNLLILHHHRCRYYQNQRHHALSHCFANKCFICTEIIAEDFEEHIIKLAYNE